MQGLINAFLIVGGAAGIGFLLVKFFGGGGIDFSGIKNLFNKKKDEIVKTEEKQQEVIKKVVKSKKISEEKKKKIKEIREKSNKEIAETLEKEDLEALLLEEEELWNS